ncbi:hypothetical protein [Lysobacter sp. HDW10]|uniref:hypothetical protein n=1 Tax=Lysobacter sp. HDW10 TaxID=2714936 RepID=UPI00197C37AE|nr:hypothetical protein [Lysobacter sp. HDW10]
MIPPKVLEKYYEPESKKENYAKAVLSSEPNSCLRKQIGLTPSLKELTPDDLAFFQAKLNALGSDLEKRRLSASARLEAAERTVTSNPKLIQRTWSKSRVGSYLIRNMPPEEEERFVTWAAIEAEQYDAAEEYSAADRRGIAELRELSWPVEREARP